MLYCLDPGNTHTALVALDGRAIRHRVYAENKEVRTYLRRLVKRHSDHMAIEMVACYGMAVGAEVFETCVAVGRFIECWGGHESEYTRIYRKDVKIALCNSMKAKDGNIRQALIDLYSGGKGASVAIGRKATPGPLYGFSGDLWAALAVGITYQRMGKALP